jgi:integrase/recombinase XerD
MEEIKLHQYQEKMRMFGYAERTVDSYGKDMALFMRYLAEKENLQSFNDLKPEHVKAWHAHLTFEKFPKAGDRKGKYHLAPSTVNARLISLRLFFKIMHQENLLPYDYAGLVVLPKKRKRLPRNVPTPDVIRRFLQVIVPNNPLTIRDRFLFELLYATGIRNEELRKSTLHQFNIQERVMLVTGKGSRDRVVPIGEWVIPYALEYLHCGRPYLVRLIASDLLFPTRNGRMMDSSTLDKNVKRYAQAAGITINMSPHVFRHACATHMIQAGADIRYVQELLGHRDLGSTQVYTSVTITDLKKAHAKYHPANRDDFEPAAGA